MLYTKEQILALISRNDFDDWFINGDFASFICEDGGKSKEAILADIERMLTTEDVEPE